jgi:hypothetical protein
VAVLLTVLVVLAMAIVVARRASGAFAQPATTLTLALAGLVSLVCAAVALAVARSLTRAGRGTALGGLGIVLCGSALAMSVPSSPAPGLAALWIATAGAVGICALETVRPRIWRVPGAGSPPRGPKQRKSKPDAARRLVSEQVRLKAEDGSERVQGWLQVEFAADQRLAVAHIGFCPPFEVVPQVHAMVDRGSTVTAVRVRVTQALHSGARLEVKRNEVSGATTAVRVHFEATAPCPPTVGPTE